MKFTLKIYTKTMIKHDGQRTTKMTKLTSATVKGVMSIINVFLWNLKKIDEID